MPIEKSKALVAKWQTRLGLANFRIHCMPLSSGAKEYGTSQWSPIAEWGVIWCPDDEAYGDDVIALTILHEMAHGVLAHTIPKHDNSRAEVERFCNRFARLVLGNWSTPEPDELDALATIDGDHKKRAKKPGPLPSPGESPEISPERRLWLNLIIDSLPQRERETMNALYKEGLSIRECAKRFGEDKRSVQRTQERALSLMRERYEALDRSYRNDPL